MTYSCNHASRQRHDAIVVGSGPNGLAAAITLARKGHSVLLIEARDTVGGGMRSAELTLPGFTHDVCSTIHALGVISPFFRTLPLAEHGLEWIFPPAALAHPLESEPAILLQRSIDATAGDLDGDSDAYRRLIGPLVAGGDGFLGDLLGPLKWPKYPLRLAKFGWIAIRSARQLAMRRFKTARARALFAGLAAHSMLPLEKSISASFALVLAASAHLGGWPIARGGSGRLAEALASYFRSLGGEIETGHTIESLASLPPARVMLFDLTPRQLLRICGNALPRGYRERLAKYRYGPGAFKMDWALSSPIPWKDPRCLQAATVHVGGSLEEIAASERAACGDVSISPHRLRSVGENGGQVPFCPPFVLLAQSSLFDASRAPGGQHTVWAYCHVPHGSIEDRSRDIEEQIERFAPGFRQRIVARHVMTPEEMGRYNPNYIGGDINGGVQDLTQLFTRPVARLNPYSTPLGNIFLCSSSTPPGGGVHGMCGYFAAQAALSRLRQ